LILSSKAQSSRWVSKEVDLAINEGKIILPFMLENCPLKDDFYFYLTNVQRYTAYEDKNSAIEKMIKEIRSIIGVKNENLSENQPKKAPEIPIAPPIQDNIPKPQGFVAQPQGVPEAQPFTPPAPQVTPPSQAAPTNPQPNVTYNRPNYQGYAGNNIPNSPPNNAYAPPNNPNFRQGNPNMNPGNVYTGQNNPNVNPQNRYTQPNNPNVNPQNAYARQSNPYMQQNGGYAQPNSYYSQGQYTSLDKGSNRLSIFCIIFAFLSILGLAVREFYPCVMALVLSNISIINIRKKQLKGVPSAVIAQLAGLLAVFAGEYGTAAEMALSIIMAIVSIFVFVYNCSKISKG